MTSKWTVEANVTVTCDISTNICAITCVNADEVPIAEFVTCTAGTWNDLVLFAGNLVDPTISCGPVQD